MVSRVGVCRGFVVVFLGRGPLLYFSGTLAREEQDQQADGAGTWYKEEGQQVLVLCYLLKLVYARDRGRKWHQPVPLSTGRGLGLAKLKAALSEKQIMSLGASQVIFTSPFSSYLSLGWFPVRSRTV